MADAAAAPCGLDTRLLAITRQTVRQAQRIPAALQGQQVPAAGGVTPPTLPARERLLGRLLAQFDRVLPRVQRGRQRGRQQAHARVLEGQPVPSSAKVLSLFEPHPRVVTRRTLGARVEFGPQVVREAIEGGIVTRVHVLADEESEWHPALPAVPQPCALFSPPPWVGAGDRRLHPKGVEETAHGLGVTQVVIPRTGPLSAAQGQRQRERSGRRR